MLFTHESRDIFFTLVVDDFAIKYKRKEDAEHFLALLSEIYSIKQDWTGSAYIGYTITRDRAKKTLTLSMPHYIPKALKRFGITEPRRTKAPMAYVPPVYGAAVQRPSRDTLPALDAAGITRIQQIVGVLLYYSRAIDTTLSTALNKISTRMSTPTTDLAATAEHALHYAGTHPNACLVFRASKMKLVLHTDASYNSETRARSRAGLFAFLGDDASIDELNAPLLCTSSIVPTVVTAVSEAEYASACLGGKQAVPIRHTLHALGYHQGTTTLICDNSCATGLANDSVKQRRSKCIDVQYHWIRDQVGLKTFRVIWRKGSSNLADYLTKILPANRYAELRHIYVSDLPRSLDVLTLH